mgnify:CR=1 FL=1
MAKRLVFQNDVNGVEVEGRRDAIAFTDGKYGYVGTGYGEDNRVFKDFYRFDPVSETWEEVSFPGESRYGGTAFVVNNAAYVCLGQRVLELLLIMLRMYKV